MSAIYTKHALGMLLTILLPFLRLAAPFRSGALPRPALGRYPGEGGIGLAMRNISPWPRVGAFALLAACAPPPGLRWEARKAPLVSVGWSPECRFAIERLRGNLAGSDSSCTMTDFPDALPHFPAEPRGLGTRSGGSSPRSP